MKLLLLLAGRGARLLPLTQTIPKPLLRVVGAPVLEHILRSVSQLEVEELVLVTSHLSKSIEVYMKEYYDGAFRIVRQKNLDGTGGAVYSAREHINGPVLIIFGDTIFDVDLACIHKSDFDGIVWTKTVEDYQRFGIVLTDADGNMRDIVEKPKSDVGRRANIGLYYIADHSALLGSLERLVEQPPINGEWYFTYALNDMVRNGRTLAVRDVASWYDCGTRTALIASNAQFLQLGYDSSPSVAEGVTIFPPVLIQDDVHIQNSIIGPNVVLETGSVVRSSTVSNTVVGRNCSLSEVIVSDSLLGEDQQLIRAKISGAIVANGKTSTQA